MNKVKEELKKMSEQELVARVGEMKNELFTLTLQSKTSHMKDVSQFGKLRKNIARALTYLRTRKG